MRRSKSGRPQNVSERDATLVPARGEGEQGSTSFDARVEERAGTPANRGEGQAKRVPSAPAGVRHSGDDPQESPNAFPVNLPPDILPAPGNNATLSDYKGTSLKNIGKDANGRVIPHKYNKAVAKKVAIWISGGYNANDICIALNIRPGKLEQLYGQEIRHGLEKVGMEVTQHIVARVKKSDRMAIFFAKSRMGWRDGDGKPMETGILAIHIHT